MILRTVITLVAGTLLPLSLAPWFWWPVGIASVATLAFLLHNNSAKQAYWRTVQFSFGMFATGASWVFVSINTYSTTPTAIAVLLTVLFVALLALIFALPFLLMGLFRSSSESSPAALSILAFPAIWVLAEWFIGWILTGFPWIYLGYGHLNSWLAGWAPLGGVWSISWIVALCAATLASVIACRVTQRAQPLNATHITAISCCLLLWLVGRGLQSISWTTTQKSLTVGILQPNISQNDRWKIDYRDRIINNNLTLGEPLWDNQLVIWPEAAIPDLKHRVESLIQQLDTLARQTDSTFITGIPAYNFARDEYYNTVVAMGKGSGEYRKQHLVIFGEYMPLAEFFRELGGFFDLPMSGFTPGSAEQPLITAGEQKVATAICYEMAYTELVRNLATDANWLLTVSNDTWFGDSLGPKQHLGIAQMRALENGKPMIRATNDGITALIDHRGKVTDTLPQFQQGILQGTITPRSGATPYNRIGSWPALLIVVITLGWCFWRRKG